LSAVANSEILLIYEAKLCNPNGDPDEENRPRIDPKTRRNLVTDLRLKRFFRDYIVGKFGEEYIYVTKIAGSHLRADQRVSLLGSEKQVSPEEAKNLSSEKIIKSELMRKAEEVPKRCIDARLFGATIPIGAEGERGGQRAYIGPVQFTWGFSLHPVELVESSTITSIFAGRRAEEQYGTMGKDWRLYYSLISFYGVISGRRALNTGLNVDDLKVFDDVLWRSLMIEPTTRSKIGEKPHLYLRVEYKDGETLLGDLRRYIDVSLKDPIREFKDVELNFDRLIEDLKRNINRISMFYLSCSEEMRSFKEQFLDVFGREVVKVLPHSLDDCDILKILRRYID
jgi:CRISPR-associated protein Csh2